MTFLLIIACLFQLAGIFLKDNVLVTTGCFYLLFAIFIQGERK